jgi:hypothetical protein
MSLNQVDGKHPAGEAMKAEKWRCLWHGCNCFDPTCRDAGRWIDYPPPADPARIRELEEAQRHAWEAGFRLCRSYGDNHAHFDGEQKERHWKKYLGQVAQMAERQPTPVLSTTTDDGRTLGQMIEEIPAPLRDLIAEDAVKAYVSYNRRQLDSARRAAIVADKVREMDEAAYERIELRGYALWRLVETISEGQRWECIVPDVRVIAEHIRPLERSDDPAEAEAMRLTPTYALMTREVWDAHAQWAVQAAEAAERISALEQERDEWEKSAGDKDEELHALQHRAAEYRARAEAAEARLARVQALVEQWRDWKCECWNPTNPHALTCQNSPSKPCENCAQVIQARVDCADDLAALLTPEQPVGGASGQEER